MWFTKGTPTKSLAPAVYVHILRESVVCFISCLCVFHANAIYDMIFMMFSVPYFYHSILFALFVLLAMYFKYFIIRFCEV